VLVTFAALLAVSAGVITATVLRSNDLNDNPAGPRAAVGTSATRPEAHQANEMPTADAQRLTQALSSPDTSQQAQAFTPDLRRAFLRTPGVLPRQPQVRILSSTFGVSRHNPNGAAVRADIQGLGRVWLYLVRQQVHGQPQWLVLAIQKEAR
jgi:nucleoid-associated protein YgaU